MTIGENQYNQGTVGSQPNYPSSYNKGTIGKKDPNYKKSYNKGTIGDQNPYPGMPPGGYGRAYGDLGAQGPGSKPLALHTEYATDGGDDRSYGSQDVVFYLMRADADSPSDTFQDPIGGDPGYVWSGSQSSLVPIEPGGGSGPNADNGNVQSGANQIGLGRAVGNLGEVTGGPMAPMSGFEIEEEEPLGRWSQNAAFSVNVATSVRNALKTVPSLGSEVVVKSLASSEQMFNRMLLNGFVPLNDLNQQRTDEQILDALDRPVTAELAFLLARETGGMTKVEDIVSAVNNGELGAVTSKSRAYQERISPVSSRSRR